MMNIIWAGNIEITDLKFSKFLDLYRVLICFFLLNSSSIIYGSLKNIMSITLKGGFCVSSSFDFEMILTFKFVNLLGVDKPYPIIYSLNRTGRSSLPSSQARESSLAKCLNVTCTIKSLGLWAASSCSRMVLRSFHHRYAMLYPKFFHRSSCFCLSGGS